MLWQFYVIMNQHINEHMCLLVYLYAKNELKFIHIIMSHIYKIKSNTTLPHLNAHTAHVHLTCISSQHDILALASYNECSYYSCFLGASLYRIVTSWCQLIYSVAKSCQNHTHTTYDPITGNSLVSGFHILKIASNHPPMISWNPDMTEL